MEKATGFMIDNDDMHWIVCCPKCEKEFEYEGFFDPGDKTKCKCGCEFITTELK